MPFSRNAQVGLLTLAACVGAPSLAYAENPGAKLVELLKPRFSSTKAHPLADAHGKIAFLTELRPGEDARSIGLREVAPGVASGRLEPDAFELFRQQAGGRQISVTPGSRLALDQSRVRSGVAAYFDATEGQGSGAGVVVGIVDTGIDLTHPGFFDEDGNTRIAWLLTWGTPRGLHPEIEEAMGCTDPNQSPCAVYSGEDLMVGGPQPEDWRDTFGHGTHVASIAAGNGERGNGQKPRYIGVAPQATLVIASPSQDGGFGDDEVLRGTKFVFDRAEAMGNLPAVVNLSLGSDFGPHDGTSLLETGTAAFIGDDKPGRVIVAAAGNSGGLFAVGDAYPLGIHTEVHVEDHAPARVPVYVPDTEGGNIYAWATFRPGDDVSVGLEGPDGVRWIGQVAPGNEAGYSDDDVDGAVVNNLVNEHSTLTHDTNGAVISWSGQWPKDSGFALTLEGHGDAQLWLVATGNATSGAYFVQATKQGTVNQPATHPRILAVGCTVNRLDWKSPGVGGIEIKSYGEDEQAVVDSACYFSGAGPTAAGVAKPELVAPGAFVGAALSVDADPRTHDTSIFDGSGCPDDSDCYVLDDRYVMATGTSMSAPHVTGAVALMLQQKPLLTQAQVTEILQAAARKPTGNTLYGSQMGAGALDLTHALEVLAEEAVPDDRVPDVAQSFWYLSAESARPDPSWSITGSVSLRRADGSIASGLDGSLLTVEVDGGTLQQAPVKILHGFFQFAIAGRTGDGGTTMTVRVLYDGKQIGATAVLPVAIDRWAIDGNPHADGGLSCAAAVGSQGQGPPAWLACAVGLFALRRKRRLRP